MAGARRTTPRHTRGGGAATVTATATATAWRDGSTCSAAFHLQAVVGRRRPHELERLLHHLDVERAALSVHKLQDRPVIEHRARGAGGDVYRGVVLVVDAVLDHRLSVALCVELALDVAVGAVDRSAELPRPLGSDSRMQTPRTLAAAGIAVDVCAGATDEAQTGVLRSCVGWRMAPQSLQCRREGRGRRGWRWRSGSSLCPRRLFVRQQRQWQHKWPTEWRRLDGERADEGIRDSQI